MGTEKVNVRPSRHQLQAHKNTEEAADNLGLAREQWLQGEQPGLDKGLSGDTSADRTDKGLKCYLYLDFHPLALGKELSREFREGTMRKQYHHGLSKTMEARYRNTSSTAAWTLYKLSVISSPGEKQNGMKTGMATSSSKTGTLAENLVFISFILN